MRNFPKREFTSISSKVGRNALEVKLALKVCICRVYSRRMWGGESVRGGGVGVVMEVSSHLNTCDIFIFLAFSCVVVVFVLIRWNLA